MCIKTFTSLILMAVEITRYVRVYYSIHTYKRVVYKYFGVL